MSYCTSLYSCEGVTLIHILNVIYVFIYIIYTTATACHQLVYTIALLKDIITLYNLDDGQGRERDHARVSSKHLAVRSLTQLQTTISIIKRKHNCKLCWKISHETHTHTRHVFTNSFRSKLQVNAANKIQKALSSSCSTILISFFSSQPFFFSLKRCTWVTLCSKTTVVHQ